MKRFALWALLAVSLSVNVGMAAVALWQRRPGSPGEPLIFSRVALDDGQRARMSELRSQLLATRDEHARRLASLRRDLAEAVLRRPEDPAALDRVLGSIAATQASYQRAVVDHVFAMRSVLRPEQRPAFEKMVAEQMILGGDAQHHLDGSVAPHH